MKGKLYLIPNTLGESRVDYVIPSGVINIVHTIDLFIVENIRSARRLLIRTGHPTDPAQIRYFTLNKHTKDREVASFLDPCDSGKDMGIISEAGVPGIADPGSEIVRIAHRKGIQVIPLTGPSSILLALMASGFNGQSFSFHGYLPIKRDKLQLKIRDIEAKSMRDRQTQIFIETPYRNNRLLEALLQICKPGTFLCIAVNLTTPEEKITVASISEWQQKKPDLERNPAVFLLNTQSPGNII
jgi:16S rRNA (cytidine1402-2'-O)-methyltransferase